MKVYYFYSSHENDIEKRLGAIIVRTASAFDIIELGDSDFELYRLPRKRITRNIITKYMYYHRLPENVLNDLLKMENYRAYEI